MFLGGLVPGLFQHPHEGSPGHKQPPTDVNHRDFSTMDGLVTSLPAEAQELPSVLNTHYQRLLIPDHLTPPDMLAYRVVMEYSIPQVMRHNKIVDRYNYSDIQIGVLAHIY